MGVQNDVVMRVQNDVVRVAGAGTGVYLARPPLIEGDLPTLVQK